jgi:hypothetical protein
VKLAECLAFMCEGDVLTVTKPDRLARSTAELLSIEADLSKRGIGMVILSMGGERLDTRNPTSKLMLTVFRRLTRFGHAAKARALPVCKAATLRPEPTFAMAEASATKPRWCPI